MCHDLLDTQYEGTTEKLHIYDYTIPGSDIVHLKCVANNEIGLFLCNQPTRSGHDITTRVFYQSYIHGINKEALYVSGAQFLFCN